MTKENRLKLFKEDPKKYAIYGAEFKEAEKPKKTKKVSE